MFVLSFDIIFPPWISFFDLMSSFLVTAKSRLRNLFGSLVALLCRSLSGQSNSRNCRWVCTHLVQVGCLWVLTCIYFLSFSWWLLYTVHIKKSDFTLGVWSILVRNVEIAGAYLIWYKTKNFWQLKNETSQKHQSGDVNIYLFGKFREHSNIT